MSKSFLTIYVAVTLLFSAFGCSKGNGASPNPPPPGDTTSNVLTGPAVNWWLTTGNQTALLQQQTAIAGFGTAANNNPVIEVDSTQQFQQVDGFGYTLTGGSAYVINKMYATDRQSLLQELFGNDASSIGISYLRISIGASDLNAAPFSYDDMPAGQTDTTLAHFSLAADTADFIPVLKAILQINPAIKLLATPWSPPTWMKDNSSTIGGSLLPQYYGVYARYLVKYIQQMKALGITIDAITPQNEPLYGGNNPSMLMSAAQQADFIKNGLGPAFQAAGISTKIIVYDHNCDRPDYPLAILNDAAARSFVNGSAFHLYGGDISALGSVHNAYPDKQVYFTEQFTASGGDFGGDLKWHLKNVVIGSMRNWSRTALEWNLANDPNYGPHTSGGCNTCKGAVTIGTYVGRNVAYYIIAHASKFVPAGSVRIGSNIPGSLQNVAFLRPDGKKVLVVENDGSTDASFNIKYRGKWAVATLAAGAVATYVW